MTAHVKVINGKRILCLADVRGDFEAFNKLAAEHSADLIIHTGDVGFIEKPSLDRATDKVLRHLITYSPIIKSDLRYSLLNENNNVVSLRQALHLHPDPLISTFPLLLDRKIQLNVPVYAVAGACEDVQVLENLRTKEYDIPNLHVLDEASTYLLHIGGIKLRLFGIGGAFVLHKLFDNGDGQATIAGGQGTTWITALQIGELIDTAQKVYDPSETRLLVSHAPPGREGLLAQLALVLKADLTLSASLHFRMSSSYNDFSVVSSYEVFMQKLVNGRSAVHEIYNSVKDQVEQVLDDNQRILLSNFLLVTNRVPAPNTSKTSSHEEAWKHTWHFNLADVSVGTLVLNVNEGKIGSEVKSEGFTYSHRNTQPSQLTSPQPQPQQPQAVKIPNESQQSHQQPTQIENNIYSDQQAKETESNDINNTVNNNAINENDKRKKSPYTLFIRGLPIPINEEEIREFFKDVVNSITTIKILIDYKSGNQRGLCYVAFNNESDMQLAEKKSGEKIKDSVINIQQADQEKNNNISGGNTAKGRGRGNYRNRNYNNNKKQDN